MKTYPAHLFGDFYLTWTNRQFDGKNISVQDTPGNTDSISPRATGIKESKSNETLTFRKGKHENALFPTRKGYGRK